MMKLSPSGRFHRVRAAWPAACTLAALLLLAGSQAEAQKLHLKSYTMDEGLPAAQVFCSLQDSRGYLWFGTSAGLVRYNGAEFRVYSVEDGLISQGVRSIVEKDGVLWIATEVGVSAFDGGTFKNYTVKDGLGKGIVWRAAHHKGELWFGTSDGGLSRFDGKRFTTYTTEQGLPSNNIFALLSDGENLWIGARGGGLSKFDGKGFANFGMEQGLDATEVFALLKSGDVLWVGTRDGGLYKYEKGEFINIIDGVEVYCAASNGDEVFFGTLGKGVYRIQGYTVKNYTSANGLIADRIYSILVDRESSVWFTTNAGISKLLSDKFLGYLEDKNIVAIEEYAGALWFGTLGEGLIRLDQGRPTVYSKENGPASNAIWSLAVYRDKLWIGSTGGLNSFDGESFETFTTDQGLIYSTVSHILVDGNDLWLSTIRGVTRFDGETFSSLTEKDGLVNIIVHSGSKVGDKVCFATEGGVSCYDGKGFTNYTEENGLPSSSVYYVFEDGDGVMWVGTNNGLARLEGSRFRVFTKKDGLGNNFVGAMVDYKGDLWLGTNYGLTIFDGERGIKRFSTKSGMIGNEFNIDSLFVDGNGTVWMGTSTGATRYFPERDKANRVPPTVYIESFSVNDEPRPQDSEIRLESGENNVEFSYAGLSFKDEHNVVFQYRLSGYDPGWSGITSDRSVRYTNLKDGEYVFMVQAGNEDGFWSEKPAELAFVIMPPFWKAWWFVLLVVLSVIAAAYFGVQHSVRRVKQRNVELEKLVEERTVELAKLNEELKELSLTDPLTRLRNRRFFTEIIDDEVAQVNRAYGDATRGRSPSSENRDLGLAIIDVDHFKQVNDSYGHKAGDEAIKLISEELKAVVRRVDVVVRWGGEEFLVLFRNSNRSHIHEMCLRLAQCIRELEIELPGGRRIKKTCSIGFSVYPFSTSWPNVFNHDEVIGLADRALYVAKNNGRDLVVGIMEGPEEIGEEDKREVKDDIRMAVNKLFIKLVCDRPELKL